MKLGVIGSRGFDDYDLMKSYLDRIHAVEPITQIVSGGASGADSLGAKWSDENSIYKKIYRPDWNKYGKKAGFLRNMSIVENSDKIIVFWDGRSKGSEHSINLCKKIGKKCKVIYYDKAFLRKQKIQHIYDRIEKNRFTLNI